MAMRLEWTESFSKALEFILTCARDFYGIRTLRALNAELSKIEGLLPNNPKLGSIEPLAENLSTEYRHVVIKKKFKLIYTVEEDCIYLVDIWDTRQAPKKLYERLK